MIGYDVCNLIQNVIEFERSKESNIRNILILQRFLITFFSRWSTFLVKKLLPLHVYIHPFSPEIFFTYYILESSNIVFFKSLFS